MKRMIGGGLRKRKRKKSLQGRKRVVMEEG
jgi:hypothetical protein